MWSISFANVKVWLANVGVQKQLLVSLGKINRMNVSEINMDDKHRQLAPKKHVFKELYTEKEVG